MHRALFLAACSLLFVVPGAPAYAEVRIGATITDEGLRSFHVAIGSYYHVPEREVIVIRERRIPDDVPDPSDARDAQMGAVTVVP